MKLFLSSARLELMPPDLKRPAANARVGVIMNALDGDEDRRALRLKQQRALFEGHVQSVTELDLRQYFDAPSGLEKALDQLDMVSVNGGETFVLRQAMARSGFDKAISTRLASDQISYVGFSAGVLVLGPSLRSLGGHDGPEVTPPGYEATKIWDGLNILPQDVIVHYVEGEPLTEKQVAHFDRNDRPHIALPDGEALLIDGDATALKRVTTG